MSNHKPSPQKHKAQHADSEQKFSNPVYRRAILASLNDLHDRAARSNVDLIRGRTQTIFEDQGHPWNEVLFIQTLRSVADSGDIDLNCHSWAQLSPSYKKKAATLISLNRTPSPENAAIPITLPHYSPPFNEAAKEVPVRKPDHDKWKIMPKKLYDKCVILNPMDTH